VSAGEHGEGDVLAAVGSSKQHTLGPFRATRSSDSCDVTLGSMPMGTHIGFSLHAL
jgi:hypothetical protein